MKRTVLGLALTLGFLSAVADGSVVHTGSGDFAVRALGNARTLEGGRLYVVETNSTFVGADAVAAGETGGCGLAVADGVTAYLYIPAGVSLTCRGGKGGPAGLAGVGRTPVGTTTSVTNSGDIAANVRQYNAVPDGGAGGTGAGGGGAGILVPDGAHLFVYGPGTLTATGGAGGDGGAGGVRTNSFWSCYTMFHEEGQTPAEITDKQADGNEPGVTYGDSVWSGTATSSWAYQEIYGQPSSGGGGGGGAGGGGAAIGSCGAAGGAGSNGAKSARIWHVDGHTKQVVEREQATSAASGPDAAACGEIRLRLEDGKFHATAGAAGKAGASAVHAKVYQKKLKTFSMTLFPTGVVTNEEVFTISDGQQGGGGGAGRAGAAVGVGGVGGTGGTGGDSGTFRDTSYNSDASDPTPAAVGEDGTQGGTGPGAEKPAEETKWRVDDTPTNTVAFAGVRSVGYAFADPQPVAIPALANAGAGVWKVSAPAACLGDPGTGAFREGDTAEHLPGGSATMAKYAYGDVTLGSDLPKVDWSWSGESGTAPISVRTDSAFAEAVGGLTGKGLGELEETFASTTNGVPLWQCYLSGVGFTNRFLLAATSATDGTVVVAPIAEPVTNAGFRVLATYRGTNELSSVTADWRIVSIRTNDVKYAVRPTKFRPLGFYTMEFGFIPDGGPSED